MDQRSIVAVVSALCAALLIAGCAGRREPPPAAPVPPVAPAAPPQAPAPAPAPEASAPRSLPVPKPSIATSLDGFKRDFAQRVHEASAAQVFDGAPPPLLRSIVVVSVVLDAGGRLVDARVLRDNGDAETVRLALESIRRASPFPQPEPRLARRGRMEILETWLFRDDGRFRLRSLAQVQQSE